MVSQESTCSSEMEFFRTPDSLSLCVYALVLRRNNLDESSANIAAKTLYLPGPASVCPPLAHSETLSSTVRPGTALSSPSWPRKVGIRL